MKDSKYILSIILLSAYPALSLYAHNLFESSIQSMFLPMIVSIVFGLVAFGTIKIFLKDTQKVFILSTALLLMFFLYGHVYLLYAASDIARVVPLSANSVLFFLFGVIILSMSVFLMKIKNVMHIASTVAIFISVLVLSVLIFIIPNQTQELYQRQKLINYLNNNRQSIHITNKDSDMYPDIYYIVFDRYARGDVLKKYFKFNNTSHVEYLENSGFSVNEKSYANYPTTYLSLASSLNMQHLTWASKLFGKTYKDKWIIYEELLNRNEVGRILSKLGYSYYFFGSSWEGTKKSIYTTKNYNVFENVDQFSMYIYENTVLNSLLGMFLGKQSFTGVTHLIKTADNQILKINKIPQLIRIKEPKYIFAHFLIPHSPNVLGANCNILEFNVIRKRDENENYINELKCASLIMRDFTKEIEKKSSRPYVIIFQSDEGPYLPRKYFEDPSMPSPMTDASIEIHSKILLAIKTSDRTLKAPKTPVNIFPLIFNRYFGASISLKSDKSYIAKSQDTPHDFMEITKKVNVR